jgi:hypothetical protein
MLTMHDPTALSQAIAQVVCCNNRLFQHREEKH